jgi:hypothetical protein
MHFHLPRPLHGWREFAGEVGIIVIGVLIALSAEQVVETAHWRGEVRDFRQAVDHELGRNLGIYTAVMRQRPCVDRRLAELERFLADSNSGRQDRLLRPIGRPFMQSQYFSVWDDKGADVTQHLPLDVRLKYGELYDEFHNNDVNRLTEREVWRNLAQFDQPEPLDHTDRMHLRELVTRAEQLNAVTPSNYIYILNLARPLGIHSIADPQNVHLAYQDDFCRPLLAQPSARKAT